MIKKDIEDIWLGPRQLSFDFEKDESPEQAVILDCLNRQIRQYGHIELDQFVQTVNELHGLPAGTILQSVFWLAKDLRIHFRVDKEIREPHQVRQLLLECMEKRVTIVPVKSVDHTIFQDVKNLYKKISVSEAIHVGDDQYELASLLAKQIKRWKAVFKTCESVVKNTFSAEDKEICAGMDLIDEITVKMDAYSLINAFYRHREIILKLPDDLKRVSDFYLEHRDFWKKLTRSLEEVSDGGLGEVARNPDIAASVEILKRILSVPAAAHDRIPEAKTMLNAITEQCRHLLLTKLEDMIGEMKMHLDAHEAGPDLRNRSLYSLRTIKKRIHRAGSIGNMNLDFIEAEENFDVFLDQIAGKSYIGR